MMLMKQKVVSENRTFPLRVASNEKESNETRGLSVGRKAAGRRNRSVLRFSRISNHQSQITNGLMAKTRRMGVQVFFPVEHLNQPQENCGLVIGRG
jgi:hypothetical protein